LLNQPGSLPARSGPPISAESFRVAGSNLPDGQDYTLTARLRLM